MTRWTLPPAEIPTAWFNVALPQWNRGAIL